MTIERNRIELLAPAGNQEKLEIAIHYGADAVYLAGKDFSLRNFSDNFSPEEMRQAIDYAHERNVKVFVACNIYSRNEEQYKIREFLIQTGSLKPDAVIIADPGIVMTALEVIPEIPIHLSTQANTTNYNTALFWEKNGVKRINTARELSLEEIQEICGKTTLEVESFVHGAMCISYSGRCLLSNFMVNRDSNRGLCSHPCRWKYSVVEEQRPGQYHDLMEDSRGSYIFNSKDLCMVAHIPSLIESGIDSLKIEGRMKGINYLASAVKVYREAIDSYYENPESFNVKNEWIEELSQIHHRSYCSGFYFRDASQTVPNYEDNKPRTTLLFAGKVLGEHNDNTVMVGVRNKIFSGEEVEIITPGKSACSDVIHQITNLEGKPVDFAQPNSTVYITFTGAYPKNAILRKEIEHKSE